MGKSEYEEELAREYRSRRDAEQVKRENRIANESEEEKTNRERNERLDRSHQPGGGY
jgi:hypothetical protein